MPTLLLRCAAPLQSWDTQSNFGVRTTGREPTKSGIIGLLCAALGRSRSEPINDLAGLHMGVRADQEGYILRDFHTAGKGGYLRANGTIEQKTLIVSTRYYLTDAVFLVGLESYDREMLATLHLALRDPRWLLFLGRKACPPSMPVYLPDGFQESELLPALKNYPWLGRLEKRYDELKRENPHGLRVVLEDRENGTGIRNDQPLSFQKGRRAFAPRRTSTHWVAWPPYETPDSSSPEN